MRRPEYAQRLRGYVAYTTGPNGKGYYNDFPVSEGAHSLAIRKHGDEFSFEIDGNALRQRAVMKMQEAYSQIGPQMAYKTDGLSGAIVQVAVRTDRVFAVLDLSDACRLNNQGLILVERDHDLVPGGAYNAALPIKYQGNCVAFKSSKTRATRR